MGKIGTMNIPTAKHLCRIANVDSVVALFFQDEGGCLITFFVPDDLSKEGMEDVVKYLKEIPDQFMIEWYNKQQKVGK